jgi:hypothetical protein
MRYRIAFCFGLSTKPSITFPDFITHMAEFNGPGRVEQKLKLAFKYVWKATSPQFDTFSSILSIATLRG